MKTGSEIADELAGEAGKPSPIMVKHQQVVKRADGSKYVAAREHALPDGAKIIANTPHEDGDMSYCCGSDYCRCMQ